MNENKFMALLLGEEINTDWWCEKCQAYIDDRQVIYQEIHEICGCPVYIKEPVYHDLEGWMSGETIRKIQAKMPDTLIHYLQDIWANPDGGEYNDYMIPKTRRMLSLSNFLAYLKEHKEEWAEVECPYCFDGKVDDPDNDTKLEDCRFCRGGKIINPEYEEAIKEMEVEG